VNFAKIKIATISYYIKDVTIII